MACGRTDITRASDEAINFARANLQSQYGKHGETAANLALKRLKLGNRYDRELVGSIYLGNEKDAVLCDDRLRAKILEEARGYWGKFADVFDPSFTRGHPQVDGRRMA